MAGERRINWGADATDARYRTEDTGDGGNFVVAEDLDGGTVLLEYDSTASEWVSRGPINMDGNAISNVSDIDVGTVSTTTLNIGGKLYERDDNSPFTMSSSTSSSFSVNGSYDELIIIPYNTGASGGPNQLRVNSDSGENYQNYDLNENKTFDTEFQIPTIFRVDYIKLQDLVGGDRVSMAVQIAGGGTGRAHRGENVNISGPITDLTMLDSGGGNVSFDAEVYGRDLS